MRALLMVDDAALSGAIERTLLAETFVIDKSDDGDDAMQLAELYHYDVILVDLDFNNRAGLMLVRRLRDARIEAAIIGISANGDVDATIDVLSFGGDDCIAKPLDGRELIARIRAVVRRSLGYAGPTIHTGKLALDLGGRVAKVAGRMLPLTKKEYGVLELLSLRKGRALEKEFFLNHLYDGVDEPEAKIVDVFICHLRKKLAQATGGEHYIETIWGRGYMMRDPEPRRQDWA